MGLNARGLVDQGAALKDDRGLVREQTDKIEIVLAEHGLVVGVRLERSKALVRRGDRRDKQ